VNCVKWAKRAQKMQKRRQKENMTKMSTPCIKTLIQQWIDEEEITIPTNAGKRRNYDR